MNENGNTTYQNLGVMAKLLLRAMLIKLCVYISLYRYRYIKPKEIY